MIQDIKRGRINCVITKDLSRLGRNYVMTGQYTDFFFPQNNVRYIAVNDNYDSSNLDNDIAPFKNILNEMYAKDISKKVRSSKTTSAKQDKFMGSKAPYGYIKSPENKHKLIIDETAGKIIQRMFRLFAGGESVRHIATIFNAEKITCPRQYYYDSLNQVNPNPRESNVWGNSTIMQLLKNQVYIGHMVQGKRINTSFKSKERIVVKDREALIVVENTHEPLIDSDTWRTVQHRMSQNKKSRVTNSGELSLFSGIIRCADCGSAMTFTTKNQSGRNYRVYRCSRYANNGKTGCSIHSISLKSLTETVLDDVKKYTKLAEKDQSELVRLLARNNGSGQEEELSALKSKLNEYNRRISEIDNLSQKLFEDKCEGNVPVNIFKTMMAKYEDEHSRL